MHIKFRRSYAIASVVMEAAAMGRKGVFVCSTIKGLLPALRRAMPAVSFVEIPSEDLGRGSKATAQWDRDEKHGRVQTFPVDTWIGISVILTVGFPIYIKVHLGIAKTVLFC